jgi:chromosome partitioning protein
LRVIVVASQKGGSGKTTLAGHIAVQAELSGFGPVAIIDMDPQGNLAHWWDERSLDTPLFAHTTVPDLASDIATMRSMGINLLVIDTPPAITDTIAEVVRLCDLDIVPMRPSPHDLRAAGATMELVEKQGKKLIFVINGAAARAKSTTETVEALSAAGPLAPAFLHQRADFAASMTDGRTVMEVPGGERSAMEVKELWDYLGKNFLSEPPPGLADSGDDTGRSEGR